jgi:hypothetical protein
MPVTVTIPPTPPSQPSASSAAALLRSIRSQLGEDGTYGVKAEASDSQIFHCIRLALEEYGTHHPLISRQAFTAFPGQAYYVPNPPVRGVTEVNLVEDTDAILLSPETALLSGAFLGFSGGYFGLSTPYDYAIFREWRELAEQTLSLRPHYQFVPEDGLLYLYMPLTPYKVSFTGMVNLDTAFDEEVDYSTLPGSPVGVPTPPMTARLDATLSTVRQTHMRWVRRLAFAQAQQVVGRMRRKYTSIPGMQGQGITLDGAALVQEGMQLWKDTCNDMMKSRHGFAPTMG